MSKDSLISTRGGAQVSIDDAILYGLAHDGGLYVPTSFPNIPVKDLYDIDHFPLFAEQVLAPFFEHSTIQINQDFCEQVFSFPLVLKYLDHQHYVLELFHGPTLSFKDFGARFFAKCLAELRQQKPIKVLVATSGDTGSAVASALSGTEGVEGYILFPQGKISQRQQAQITCWGGNVHAIAVHGTFDQCQQLVKKAFTEEQGDTLTTANSINIARLLPQVLFYAYSSIQIAKLRDSLVNYIVPSGNLGNVTACYWAKQLGFPIGDIKIATNKNAVLSDFLSSGIYQAQPSVKTLANAMDVGDPSNLERLRHLFTDFPAFKAQVNALSVDDEAIKAAIVDCYTRYRYLICPHTATAYHRLSEVETDQPWVMTATAHPTKFEEIIEPLLNIIIPVPPQLQILLKAKQKYHVIKPEITELMRIMRF